MSGVLWDLELGSKLFPKSDWGLLRETCFALRQVKMANPDNGDNEVPDQVFRDYGDEVRALIAGQSLRGEAEVEPPPGLSALVDWAPYLRELVSEPSADAPQLQDYGPLLNQLVRDEETSEGPHPALEDGQEDVEDNEDNGVNWHQLAHRGSSPRGASDSNGDSITPPGEASGSVTPKRKSECEPFEARLRSPTLEGGSAHLAQIVGLSFASGPHGPGHL